MRYKTCAAALAVALFFSAGMLAAELGPYQETVAEIMARQKVADLIEGPRPAPADFSAPRRDLPGNPLSPPTATFPFGALAVAPPSPNAPQTPGVNVLGATLADTGAFPPDTMGAAGPAQFVVAINGRVRTLAKSTGAADGVLNADMDVFFNSVRNGQTTSDPRVRYDRLSGRWIVTIINFNLSFSNNRVLIAVSNTSTITASTVWTYFYFQHNLDAPIGDTGLFLDYDTLGVDANALTIGGNIFDPSGNFQGTTVHVVRKSTIVGGVGGNLVTAGNVVAFRNLTGGPTGSGPYTPQGVDNLNDAAPTVSWVIGVDNASFGLLQLRKISFSATGAWPPTGISANLPLTVPATAFPLSVPHMGNSGGADGELDALDDRLFAAHLRGGHLWTAHNIAVNASGVAGGNRDGSRWYELDVSSGSPALVESGTLFDPSASNPIFYWIPSIMVSGQGHAAIGTSFAGSTVHVNATTAGRLAGDAAGSLQSPLAYTSSATSYNPPADPGPARRWGDYSYTSVDPNDDMTMWTIQEYCNATDSYGVRILQLIAPPPATPTLATPASIASGLSSVGVLITGTALSGSGFYDPGTGFPNRLQASVSGGVSVNGVAYAGPTSITLDLNTVGAAPGPRTVTVSNPDGQNIASAPGILSLTTGGPAPTVTAIAPTSGSAAAATAVAVTGSNFVTGASLTIGGLAATGVSVPDAATIDAMTPVPMTAGTLNDVTVANPDTQSATLPKGWFADFTDVPHSNQFHNAVERIFRDRITAGCGDGTTYCPSQAVTRAEMAVFLLKGEHGSGYTPPACTGIFGDVRCTPTPDFAVNWIEQLHTESITAGCHGGVDYCPNDPVMRAEMAVLLLKAEHGPGYTPPTCTGVFTDVACTPTPAFAVNWIEALYAEGVTVGCGTNPLTYCPGDSVPRDQMAVFLSKAFSLP